MSPSPPLPQKLACVSQADAPIVAFRLTPPSEQQAPGVGPDTGWQAKVEPFSDTAP